MKVLKFGGTSVGTIESLTNVKRIVESIPEPAIVVVSALGGLTDKLITTAKSAATGSEEYLTIMEGITKRHYDIIDALLPESEKESIREIISGLLSELSDIYKGLSLIKSLPSRTLDMVVSFGERMSSVIVSGIIEGAEHHDSLSFMRTERWFNKDIADRILTDKNIKEEFRLPLQHHAVMGGFISKDRDTGEITNLGRGGSDYTAALVAAALNADILEIWTDVDGFMTSDPRIIKTAKIIPSMTFVESMELCSYGAKVIYPPTIYPVFHKNIPIKILNTFNPTAPGTHISDTSDSESAVRGVSSMNHTAMITIKGQLASNLAEINSRAYNVMARNGISMLLVAQPDKEHIFSFAISEQDVDTAYKLLQTEFAPELHAAGVDSIEKESSLSIIAVVGESIRSITGLGARLVNTLQRNGVSVKAVSDGASDTTIAIVVPAEMSAIALSLIHESAIE